MISWTKDYVINYKILLQKEPKRTSGIF